MTTFEKLVLRALSQILTNQARTARDKGRSTTEAHSMRMSNEIEKELNSDCTKR